MPFGLYNGPASFQNYINNTLHEYLDNFCTMYLNDILIYSDNEAEHKIHIKCVLQKLEEAGLQVNITKCAFYVTQVPYLGLIITIKGVKMNSVKVSIIVKWFPLMNIKDVQSFLSFANFYQRFIYGYSKLASLLTCLTKKDVPFEWITECQFIFNALKKAFTSDVILRHYNLNLKIIVETDTSDYVSGGILSQYDKNDVLSPIAYFFKKHNPAECNYEIYNKELMAIVCAFKEWCSELEGSTYPIDVITDHKNLEYFMFIKQLSHCQAHWSKFLSCFNYHITYCSEKAGGKLNALTCCSGDLSKERDTLDSCHQYQHQMVLKSYVLDDKIKKNLCLELRTIDLQCQIIVLDLIQLHLCSVSPLSLIILALMNMETEEPEVNDVKPQLD